MFKHKDINEYLKEKEDSTILLDVRTKEEYEEDTYQVPLMWNWTILIQLKM